MTGAAQPLRGAAPPVLVEACVDTVGSALAAEAGGAGRVELCAALVEGGTTPSAGTVARAVERLRIPVVVLVRPRGGDFLYDADELEVMRRDVAHARAAGAAGIAAGALTPDGRVDEGATDALVRAAGPLPVTFHRAFDVVRDQAEALETLAALGIARVLTAGGAPAAADGSAALAALVRQAAGRVTVLAGGGVTEDNVAALVAATGVGEVHVRGAEQAGSAMRHRRPDLPFGKPYVPDAYARTVTSADRIRRVVAACAGATRTGPVAPGRRPGLFSPP